MKSITEWLRKRYMLIMVLSGSGMIILWTLLRFWADKSIFDLVGQQLLARMFMQDGSMDAVVGATHYILKMFLIYMPFEVLPIDPRLSLVLMTLLINVGSFIAILFAIRSILCSLKMFRPGIFTIGMLWLASIAGSVFWIEFANSRNIEVAAGLWVIALGLKYLAKPSIRLGVVWLTVCFVAFLMDPLQVYMTGVPLLAYMVIVELRRRLSDRENFDFRKIISIVLILAFGYLLARLALEGIELLSGVRVIDDRSSAGSPSSLSGHLFEAFKGVAIANIRIFAGYVEDGGRLRRVIALLSIVSVVAAWALLVIRKKIKGNVVLLVCIFMAAIQSIYFLSGQSLNGDTSRYLIMAAPILIIVIATLPKIKITNYMAGLVSFAIAVNCIFLLGAVIKAWPDRYTQDKQLGVVANFVDGKSSERVRFYGSMDTALPTTFYYPNAKILPLSCASDGLARAKTFYPKSSYDRYQSEDAKFSAIILDAGGGISNYPNVCNEAAATRQLGKPLYKENISGGATVLYYDPSSLQF